MQMNLFFSAEKIFGETLPYTPANVGINGFIPVRNYFLNSWQVHSDAFLFMTEFTFVDRSPSPAIFVTIDFGFQSSHVGYNINQ